MVYTNLKQKEKLNLKPFMIKLTLKKKKKRRKKVKKIPRNFLRFKGIILGILEV